MEAPLALYRRYRPRTFAEVIGQDHVTEPLQQALANNRVHHAYLFSGPRGCGKTTSARILARELNGIDPSDTSDSIDIIEIDAASHGGVDDARELRERAFFAPVDHPYKIYIIDEAHMVSSQGFNALLKLVEEPPPHLKFIFATTEPDKVIGTIRSRTHHYPFRLVPPKLLSDYLLTLCEAEGVAIESAALPMVVRAGGGSVRDTLSVLDQLLAGAGSDGVTYRLASTLLGYTPDEMLDELVDAIAARDGSTVFAIVDRVIESGQDPRRFTEDLLHRLRDLVIAAAVKGEAAGDVLDVPPERLEALRHQAARFGPAEITRGADIVSAALTDFRGATAPRILLELMCMRILLPGADHSEDGLQARLDRLERRLDIGAAPTPAKAAPAPAEAAPAPAKAAPAPAKAAPAPAEAALAPEPVQREYPEPPSPPEPVDSSPTPEPAPEPEPPATEPEPPATGLGDVTIIDVRRLWDEVLETVKDARRFAWVMLSQNAQVQSLDADVLTIALPNEGARDSFTRSKSDEILIAALHTVLGVDWRIRVVTQGDAAPAAPEPEPAPEPEAPRVSHSEAARDAVRPTRESGQPSAAQQQARQADDAVGDDDPLVDETGVDHEALLARELGAQIIDEPDR